MEPDEILGLMADDAQATERVHIPENKNTNKEDVVAEDVELNGDDQDFDRTPWDDRKTEETSEEETSEPSKQKEETDTNTETNISEETSETASSESEAGEEQSTELDVNAWLSSLPTPPVELGLEAPVFADDGTLENMTGQEFLEYTKAAAIHEARVERYNDTVLTRALDEAEKVLPEIKTNDQVRQMVENQYIAKTINGESYNLVAAAADVKALIGGFKSQGAQNAKTSITKQRSAGVEAPSNTRKSDPTKSDNIAKRLKSGDKSASEDLFALWLDEGKI